MALQKQDRTRLDHRQHLTVETPEHVILDYELAGLGSRMLAFLADLVVVAGLFGAGLLVTSGLGGLGSAWPTVVLGLIAFALYWGYFALFEGLRNGQTPGKRWVGIRVVRDSGHPITLGDAAARNLIRVADALPPPFLLGLALIAFHPRAKRLGDLVAGTVVVRDRPARVALRAEFRSARAEPSEGDLGPPLLTDSEYRVLSGFLERASSLDEPVKLQFASRLVARFADRLAVKGPDDLATLGEFYGAERNRRAGRLALRAGGGKGPAGTGLAQRIVREKAGRWEEFRALADAVSLKGLDSLGPGELLDFAARYREVAADLARTRTYGAPPDVIYQLERLVAAGHNALYRRERGTWGRTKEFLLGECPAAVVEARGIVSFAFLAFLAPAAAGYTLLRERPALAADVLPEVMLERAEAGARRQREGRGYFEAEAGVRPLVATSIIANNVTVAFYCFAGGVFLGVGSLVILGLNGLQIGAATGHFANQGLFGYLWTFIAGHGLLELFAIWVAASAGFLLGRAIIAPGRLARRDALVLRGRQAIRMIAVVVLLLLVAGLAEGFVSASAVPLAVRLSVSAASAALLALYLANGARYLERKAQSPA